MAITRSIGSASCTFTGSISTTTLTTSGVTGTIHIGDLVTGGGVTADTVILSQLSGTTGGAGTYSVSQSQSTSPTGSGRYYSTLVTWHAAFATGGWIGECYNDANPAFTITTTIALSGNTTSVTDFQTLRCGAGQSINGQANTTPLSYDPTKGVAVVKTSVYNQVITLAEDFTTIQGIQFVHTGTGINQVGVQNSSSTLTHCVLDSCLIEVDQSGGGSSGSLLGWRSGTAKNSVLISRGATASSTFGVDLNYAASTPVLDYLTIVRPSNLTNTSTTAITAASGAYTVKNSAIFGFATLTSGGGTPGGSNNASNLAIGFGTSNQASLTYTSQFQVTTDATRDFRAKTGAALLDNGVADTITTDFYGTTRPQGATPDIGAYELPVATGGVHTMPLTGAGLGMISPGEVLAGAVGAAIASNPVVTRRRIFLGGDD